MKMLALILFLCTSIYSQSPQEWWDGEYNTKGKLIQAGADSSQKAMADTVYKIGVKYGNKGHTAVGIPWMETSLGACPDHGEDSFGYCGLSEVALQDMGHRPEVFDSLKAGTLSLETEIFLALDYFFLCKKRLQDNGLSPKEAYLFAYPKYSTGKHWRRFRARGEVFRARVRFLMKEFK